MINYSFCLNLNDRYLYKLQNIYIKSSNKYHLVHFCCCGNASYLYIIDHFCKLVYHKLCSNILLLFLVPTILFLVSELRFNAAKTRAEENKNGFMVSYFDILYKPNDK